MLAAAARTVRDALATDDDAGATDTGTDRVTAARDHDELVVFVVGMRVNVAWKLHRWLPVALVAPRLLRELRAADDGLLGSWSFVSPPRTVGFVQYWESFESLRAYASDPDRGHVDAWGDFEAAPDDGAVGIWHETYRVDAQEALYVGVPPRGLGAAEGSTLVDATGDRQSAASRLAADDAD